MLAPRLPGCLSLVVRLRPKLRRDRHKRHEKYTVPNVALRRYKPTIMSSSPKCPSVQVETTLEFEFEGHFR